MELVDTPLDCKVIKTSKFGDDRGFFMEAFHAQKLSQAGLEFDVRQINFAKSERNVLRGLHFQKGRFAQAKVVGILSGSVLDVVVDIRPESKTYLEHFKIVLSDPSELLYIPRGYAHGYHTLEDDTIFHYAVDNFYAPDQEGGLRYDDPKLRIDWSLVETPLISPKDLNHSLIA